MNASTGTPTEAVSTDTAVVRALRRIRVPQTQRNRELALLIFAFAINGSAIALVQLRPDVYESPMFSHNVPSLRSTRRASRKTATMVAMNSSGVVSPPICSSVP